MAVNAINSEPLKAKDYKSEVKPIWCPGCGDFGVLASFYDAIAQMQLDPINVCVVAGIGCSGRFPAFTTVYGIHTLHGRVMPVLLGIKTANPDLNVIGMSGDGDATAIGGNHFMHACRRNIDTTYMVLDNNLYALTKGQSSPTTGEDDVDDIPYPSSPYGTYEDPVEPCTLALAFGATWVARELSNDKRRLTPRIIEAMNHPGFAFLHIYSPCITFYEETVKAYKEQSRHLPDDYDPVENKFEAMRLASDPNHKYIGLLFKTEKPTYEERITAIQKTALQQRGPGDIAAMLDSYRLDAE